MTQSLPTSIRCPLCAAGPAVDFHRDAQRDYLRCGRCQLVFVLASYHLPATAEKAYYDLHENDPEDAGYRRFLDRVFAPLGEKLLPGARGLDFGSGPGPTLSGMLAEAGFPTVIYDPFYAPGISVWQEQYDFVTATEVVEHLHRPMKDLQRVWDVLKPGGWLGIMTKRVLDVAAFARWHYKDDPTHVVFFAEATFHWLAGHWSAKVEIVGPDVVFLQKLKAVT
jgi:2-polyprenyl-3-methyl-5-hydroxy-6-metoxy-1,4-benzoquinol methylase